MFFNKKMNPSFFGIKRAYTTIEVLCGGSVSSIVYPFIGPGTYEENAREIKRLGLRPARPEDEIASLLHLAYINTPEEIAHEASVIRGIFENSFIHVPNITLPVDQQGNSLQDFRRDAAGYYIVFDKSAKGKENQLQPRELEQALANGFEIGRIRFSKDKTVRFVPKETCFDKITGYEDLARHGFAIGQYLDGVPKLVDVSRVLGFPPSVSEIDPTDHPFKTSAILRANAALNIRGEFGECKGYSIAGLPRETSVILF
jgi:hypothetical protein